MEETLSSSQGNSLKFCLHSNYYVSKKLYPFLFSESRFKNGEDFLKKQHYASFRSNYILSLLK